jgi:hypothetical protein
MTFNISCCSKIKNIQKVCGIQKVSVQKPQLGAPSPSWGKFRRTSGDLGTGNGTDVVNTRRWDQEQETEVGQRGVGADQGRKRQHGGKSHQNCADRGKSVPQAWLVVPGEKMSGPEQS